jgi:hypothetical protein
MMKLLRRTIKITIAPLVLLVLLALSLASAWLYTYHRLTDETVIAEITFDQLDDGQHYLAHLATGDLCQTQEYQVYGDQWRVDAAFIKWKYWANLLGLDAYYRLERLQGRYREVTDENLKPHMAHGLADPTVFDLAALSRSLGQLNFLLDAEYGSSTYQDIRTDMRYRVYRTQTGIITRMKPRSGAKIAAGRLTIEIDKACATEAGTWQRSSQWLNQRLLKVKQSDNQKQGGQP